MRVAVLSDLHANLPALEAVGKDLEERRVDRVWCLGDVVGYGADPVACLEWVARRADVVLKGNHDEAVAAGQMRSFNPLAAQAARLHAQVLTPPQRDQLYGWPERVEQEAAGTRALLVHGSPDDPLYEYVQPADAGRGLHRWQGVADVILMGHTHRPFAAELRSAPGAGAGASAGASGGGGAGAPWRVEGFQHAVSLEARAGESGVLLVNPGSVGQPRDLDPRASYAVLDLAERTVELRRVAYDVDAAASAILRLGLDRALAMRLYEGR